MIGSLVGDTDLQEGKTSLIIARLLDLDLKNLQDF